MTIRIIILAPGLQSNCRYSAAVNHQGSLDHSLGYQTTAWANRSQPGLIDHSLGYQATAWATRPQPGLPDHSLG